MQNEKFTTDQIEQYLQDWQASGLSKKAFCKLQGIKYHIFTYWFSKVKIMSETSCFVPVEVSSSSEVVIISQAGFQIKLPLNDSTVHFVKQLLIC